MRFMDALVAAPQNVGAPLIVMLFRENPVLTGRDDWPVTSGCWNTTVNDASPARSAGRGKANWTWWPAEAKFINGSFLSLGSNNHVVDFMVASVCAWKYVVNWRSIVGSFERKSTTTMMVSGNVASRYWFHLASNSCLAAASSLSYFFSMAASRAMAWRTGTADLVETVYCTIGST